MFRGIRVSICREGWYYLFVVLFILGGAIMREVNLLVILAGMMIGPVIFNWRFVRSSLQGLKITRKFPSHISAGDKLHVDVATTNTRKRLSTWTLVIEDLIELQIGRRRRPRTSVELLFSKIRPGETVTETYTAELHQRGRYALGPARASSRFPMGLIQATYSSKKKQELIVCPRLGQLSDRWIQIVEADRVGSQKTHHRRGITDGDYYGIREWRAGDSIRWIHWRTTARIGEPAVRQFEQQRNRDVAILVDVWQPKQPTEDQLETVERALSFAATAVIDLCRRGGSHLIAGVTGTDEEFWSAMTSTGLAQEVLEALATVEAGPETRLQSLVERSVQQNRPGMRTIVISTRPSHLENWRTDEASVIQDSLLAQATWIDVNDEGFGELFRLTWDNGD